MATAEKMVRDDFETTRVRVREELSALNARLEAVAWSDDLSEVERLVARRNALELVAAAGEREGWQRERIRSEEAAAARRRRVSVSSHAAARAREREAALSRVVAFDEEMQIFARQRLPNAKLHERLRARFERAAMDGDAAALRLWRRAEHEHEGVHIYIESLQAEREELRAKYGFTEEEITAHAAVVERERARMEDLVVRGLMPPQSLMLEGLVG
jgi:hypothetical protein